MHHLCRKLGIIPRQSTNLAPIESNETEERDWSSLPPEVLNLIAKKISEISDFVRFRTVCSSWRSSTPTSDLPPQFPWILESYRHPYQPDLSFYSIPSNKIYNINAPRHLDKWLFRPLEGYMHARLFYPSDQDVFDPFNHRLSLLNPLNKHEIPLPVYDFFGGLHYWIGPRQNEISQYVVCDRHARYHNPRLISWHLGQDKWCESNLDSDLANCEYFYLKHMLFNVERDTGVTKVVDIATGTLVYVIPPIEGYSEEATQYIVEASGDILGVIWKRRSENRSEWFSDRLFDGQFDVYRLDVHKTGSPCWVKVTSIGDHALFIDSYGTLILRSNDFSMIERNSIYFYGIKNMGIHEQPSYMVKRMDIETGALEHLPCPLRKPGYWFVPTLHHI
ncbi:F-box protein (DUF295) [Rhynchospora pubera]|uniref:F-box protein (DUF295) n=1 Tax=Rhynchospora pubera TaxID=906938 RepID=A0AAV8H4A2_9POAL|nr:F-box protein (DUF295) [Rhynchospora pubera]